MSTTATPDRFTTLPDEHALQTTVVALEEHEFSVEVVGDLDAARQAVLARNPGGLVGDDQHLGDAGRDRDRGRDQRRRRPVGVGAERELALDFATQAQQMKAIGGQPRLRAAGGRRRAGRLRAAQPGRESSRSTKNGPASSKSSSSASRSATETPSPPDPPRHQEMAR